MSIVISSGTPKQFRTDRMFFENAERFQRQVPPTNPFNSHIKAIIEKYNVKTHIELGCGLGIDVLTALGCGLDSYGIDGSEKLREHVLFPQERYYTADLTQDLKITPIPQMISCREVAEHLPYESSLQLVKNIVYNSKVTYFTAAPPGQKGSGHINCRTKTFWLGLFEEFGWAVDEPITQIVKDHSPSNIDRKSGMVLFGINWL
jgi:hypothetical protein